jgi:L-ascorbate metabolism protein UlaG (beta-lactamase superfamily)
LYGKLLGIRRRLDSALSRLTHGTRLAPVSAMTITRYLDLDPAFGADVEHGTVLFIGTATVLLRYAGFTLLTDPNFLHRGEYVRLGYGLRSRRLTEPALEIEALPPLDLVVLSHLHEDHWDRVAEALLPRSTPIVTTPEAADTLGQKGFLAPEPLATWQTLAVSRGEVTLRITSMPGRHGGPVVSRFLPSVMGSLLEFETDAGDLLLRMYVTGDTLVYEGLREVRHRYRDIDLALLHLGGTRIAGVLLTMDARQGVEAVRIVDPKVAIPIHYDDYTVFKSPLSDFQREDETAGVGGRVHVLRHGEAYHFTGRPVRWRPAPPQRPHASPPG